MTQTLTISALIGTRPAIACRVIAPKFTVHRYPATATPGDPCLCGRVHKAGANHKRGNQ